MLYSSDPSVKTIFRDLSLHNYTQNQNEALNGIIGEKCPKGVFVKRDTIEIGVCSTLINFNEGVQGIKVVAINMGLKIGHLTVNAMVLKERQRVPFSSKKQSEKGQQRRTMLRGVAKGWIDKEKEEEGGDSYSSGAF